MKMKIGRIHFCRYPEHAIVVVVMDRLCRKDGLVVGLYVY